MRSDLTALQQNMGYTFKDISLLETALTHASYANERRGGNATNVWNFWEMRCWG